MTAFTNADFRNDVMGRADLAYRELEERIVTLRLPPGALLSEQSLSKELGIGRTPVREALQRLHHEGLVHILPRRGILVSEIDVKQQFRMVELRREVERFVVRAACRRGPAHIMRELEVVAEKLDRAADENDVVSFMRLDQEMDRATYAMAQNELATRTMRLMSGLTRRFWYMQYVQIGDVSKCARLHAYIAHAVVARDAERAAEYVDQLLDYIEELSYASLDPGSSERSEAARQDSGAS